MSSFEELKNAPEGSAEHNEYLCMEYPFLIPRNPVDDEIREDYDFTYILIDGAPDGWRTLILNLCEEIARELDKFEGAIDEYRVLQVKEKFGMLCWYDYGAPENSKVEEIKQKYTEMSKRICVRCGRPAEVVTTSWIQPYCNRCVPSGAMCVEIRKEN